METEDDEQLCSNCKRPVSSANFATHSAFCERNIFVCKICDEPVQISEKDQHLEEYHVVIPCDLCQKALEKWILPKHLESCPKRLIVCDYCEAEFPCNEHSEHVEFCGSRTEKCLLCQKYIMFKEKAKHDELHRYEKIFRRKSIEEEIKQNKVNEIMSTGSSEERNEKIPEAKHKFSFDKERVSRLPLDKRQRVNESFTDKSRNKVRGEDQNLGIQALEGAVASFPNKTTEKSKHYAECHICKQSIPWIDMNTHVPSCASSAGKCSLCGEAIPSSGLKEHMKKHFQASSLRVPQNDDSDSKVNRSDEIYVAGSRKSKQSLPWIDTNTHVPSSASSDCKCPFCGEAMPSYGLQEHMKKHLQASSLRVPQNDDSGSEMNRSRSDEIYAAGSRVTDQTIKCPYCSQLCSEDRILSHTRTCSMNVYECPLCTETVLETDRAKHETSECRMIQDDDQSNRSRFSRNSSQSFYECPLCSENVPEEDKDKHVSFECKHLMNSGGTHGFYNMKDDLSDMYECPLCLESMLQKDKTRHESFECRVLIESRGMDFFEPEFAEVPKKTCECGSRCNNLKSYAQAAKKTCGCNSKGTSGCDNNKGSQNSEVCIVCKNRIPSHKMAEHRRSCQRLKLPCLHCNEMIDAACEEIHLRSCKGVGYRDYTNLSTRVYQNSGSSYGQKGAIPKNTNFRDMVRPRTAKCMHCKTTLNADIVKYHEEECVQRPVTCPDCSTSITMKELGVHTCKKKKGKGKNQKANHEASEERDTPGIKKKFLNLIGYGDKKEEDKNEVNRYHQYQNPPTRYSHSGYIPDEIGNSQHIYSHLPTHYSHSGYVPPETGGSQHLYFSETDDTLIPCEFCHQTFTASEIVLHETGCRPELVSFAKPSSSQDMQLNKSGSGQDSNRSKNIHTTDMKSPFFAEPKSMFPSTKFERINHRESNVQPGEFLKSTYDKSSTELNKREENAAKEKKKEPLSLLSVWNARSSNDSKAEDDDDDSKQISDHSDGKMDVDQTEEAITISKRERRRLKENEKEISEKFDNDSEMTEFMNFLKPDENKNTESDEEYQIISDVNDVKAQPKVSENEKVLVSNFSDDVQEKRHKDLNLSKKTINDEEWEKKCKEASRFIDSLDEGQKEYVNNSKLMKDFRFGAHKSKPLSDESNVHRTVLPEKNDEEPEKMYEQKPSRCANSVKDEKEYVSNERQQLSDFKYGTHKTRSLFSEDNHTALLENNIEEPEKLNEKYPSKYSDSAKNDKECVSNLGHLSGFKFGAHKTPSSFSEGNVHHTSLLEKNIEESEKLFEQKLSRYFDSAKDEEEYVSNLRQQLSDLKYSTQKTRSLFSEDNHTALLEKNNEEPEKLNEQKPSKSIDSAKNEKEYNLGHLSDFKFGAHKTPSSFSEGNVHHTAQLEKNEEPKKLCEQKLSKYTDSAKDEKEYLSNYRQHLTDFEFGTHETKSGQHLSGFKFGAHKPLSSFSESNVHCTAQLEKEKPKNLCEEKLSKYIDSVKDRKEYLSNIRQHLTDFKFGTHETRSSEVLHESNRNTIDDKLENSQKQASRHIDDANRNYKEYIKSDFKFGATKTRLLSHEDNVHHTNLPDEKHAFKIEPAYSKDANIPIHTLITKEAKGIEDLDERIAKLHKRSLAAGDEKNDVTTWKKWRDTKPSCGSGSD